MSSETEADGVEDTYRSMWEHLDDDMVPHDDAFWSGFDVANGDELHLHPGTDLLPHQPHSSSTLTTGEDNHPRAITPFSLADLEDSDDIHLGWQTPPHRHPGYNFSTAEHPRSHTRPEAEQPHDWLDRPAQGRESSFGYLPENLFFDTHSEQSLSQSPPPPRSPGPRAGDLNELRERRSSATMPPTRRSQQQTIDLTADSSPEMARSVKRSAAENPPDAQSSKRAKTEAMKIEEIDLANDPTGEEVLKQKELERAVQGQQQENSGPQRLGKLTCIICLENFTNMTTTVCGHVFCHECITQALIAGEKNSDRGTGNCPACRKPLSRKKQGQTKQSQIIPLNLMKKSAFHDKKARAGALG